MDDLIRRKDALQAIAQLPLPYGVQRDKIITALYEVPAVEAEPMAEVAPVVQCKDCRHRDHLPGIDAGWSKCKRLQTYTLECDFCSRAEREEKL